jgi:uncharacterized protein YgfB (UPF0149 family)
MNIADRGDKLAQSVDHIRYMLYGLSLDARQAQIAQKAIDEAIDSVRSWRECRQDESSKTNV